MSVSEVPRTTSINPYRLLFLFAGAVAVAYVALGASLLRQHPDQNALSSEIESADVVLARAGDVRRDVEGLSARLAEAQRELAAAQVAFPSELHSNDIMQALLTLVDENELNVLSADTIPPAADSPGEASAATSLTFDLQVAGDLGQLVQLVMALGVGATNTTTISIIALQESGGQYVLDLELVAHARSLTGESSREEADTGSVGTDPATDDGRETLSE